MKASYVFAAVVVALAASASARQLKTYVLVPGDFIPAPAPTPKPTGPWGNLPGSSTGTIPVYPNQANTAGVADAFCEDPDVCDTQANTGGFAYWYADYSYAYSYSYSYASGDNGNGGQALATSDAYAYGDNNGVSTFTRTGAYANLDGSGGAFSQSRGSAFAGETGGSWINPFGKH